MFIVDLAAHRARSSQYPVRQGHSTQVATAAGICEWAVAALCGTGGGIGCYGACIALGLVNGPGGIGCAAVCALIASLGCTEATTKSVDDCMNSTDRREGQAMSSQPAPALAVVVGLAVAAGFAIGGAQWPAIVIAGVCAFAAWLTLALLRRRH